MKIAVIGSGTWGTALAQVLDDNGHDVLIYAREEEQCLDIQNNHQNKIYFGPDVYLSKSIRASMSLKETLEDRDYILLSVPTKVMRSVLNEIKPLLRKRVTFINTSKGFDIDTDQTMASLIREVISEKYRGAVVSLLGPSHAEEVIKRNYTTINSVSKSIKKAQDVQKLFANNYFRVYTTTDEIGCEIAASLKNGIAIASGAADALELGDNAKAALITRGLAEIARFGQALGAQHQTFYGLSGIGDLIVTCCSPHSRNYQAGVLLGKHGNAEGLLESRTTIEGLRTVETVHRLLKKYQIEMPIFGALYEVIFNNKGTLEAIQSLFDRPLKAES